MYLSRLAIQGFRNLCDGQMELSPSLNLIYGKNGAGKSSLIESIVYLLSGRSFRNAKAKHLVKHQAPSFSLFGEFSNSHRLGMGFDLKTDKRVSKLNGKSASSLAAIAGLYPVQVLSPESYHLIDSGPNERRKYLDWLLFHVEHRYFDVWKRFNRVLKQRNAALREYKKNNLKIKSDQIFVWDKEFVELANRLDGYRENLLIDLIPVLAETLADIGFDYADSLCVNYYPGYREQLADRLFSSRTHDLNAGFTHYGPHKSDIRFKIAGDLVKDVLSRGQKKILINALYLSQTKFLKSNSGKASCFLLDDFSSELDITNQSALLSVLGQQEDVQVVITSLNAEVLNPLIKGYNNARMFHVEQGVISSVHKGD